MGQLTTHVLDTANGCAAAGVRIDLYSVMPHTLLQSVATNTDGRVNDPLLGMTNFVAGEYELIFHIGDYFRALGVQLPNPPFLDKVVLRVGLADRSAHYHVPLLVSPWAYSTYRGS